MADFMKDPDKAKFQDEVKALGRIINTDFWNYIY